MTNSHNSGKKANVYSPIWSTENLEIPRDRVTINAWCRSLYALNHEVNRIINQHSILPLKYFKLKECNENIINNFYNNMLDILDMPSILENILQEYFMLGEVFVYTEMDERNGQWNRILIQNPDYIIVKRTVIDNEPSIFLRPDENLRRLVFSSNKEDIKKTEIFTDNIIKLIKNRENIPLDNFHISHFVRKTSPYEIRGTSLLVSLFPIFKKSKLDEEDLSKIQLTLMDVKILNNIQKDILYQRYVLMFNMLENWINKKLFIPVAKINKFYKPTPINEEKILNFPKVEFDKTQLRQDLEKI